MFGKLFYITNICLTHRVICVLSPMPINMVRRKNISCLVNSLYYKYLPYAYGSLRIEPYAYEHDKQKKYFMFGKQIFALRICEMCVYGTTPMNMVISLY